MDKFATALDRALPGLQRMVDQLGRVPVASASALDRLATAARDSRSLTRRVVAPSASTDAIPVTPENSPVDTWTWESLESAMTNCTKCPHLAVTRTQVVLGTGNRNAELLFVGEAPSADEDIAGAPLVGEVGVLFNKIISAMGLARDQVFVANVIKCRPDMPPGTSGSRQPRADELSTCLPWLHAQIHLVQPRVIVALGAAAVLGLTGEKHAIGSVRGRWLECRGIPVMPTHHVSHLVKNQSTEEKRKVWEDLLAVMERMEMPITAKQRKFFTN